MMKLLLVDDHELFRFGLLTALQNKGYDFSISEADSIQMAQSIVKASGHTFDLVLLDQKLPDGNGLDFVAYLRQHYPLLPVAMLSAVDSPVLMKQSLDMGAMGYIPKRATTAVIAGAIQLMLSGGIYVPPMMMSLLRSDDNTQAKELGVTKSLLTVRQQEVMSLICEGLSNKEIGWQLGVSEGTIKAHVSVILKVKGVFSRKQIIALSPRNSAAEITST